MTLRHGARGFDAYVSTGKRPPRPGVRRGGPGLWGGSGGPPLRGDPPGVVSDRGAGAPMTPVPLGRAAGRLAGAAKLESLRPRPKCWSASSASGAVKYLTRKHEGPVAGLPARVSRSLRDRPGFAAPTWSWDARYYRPPPPQASIGPGRPFAVL